MRYISDIVVTACDDKFTLLWKDRPIITDFVVALHVPTLSTR